MKYILTIAILLISACDSSNTEVIKIGSEKTEYLSIEEFPQGLKAKNIILAVGDGGGLNQVMLSRLAIGGMDHKLSIDQLPYHGISLTHSYNNIYTD